MFFRSLGPKKWSWSEIMEVSTSTFFKGEMVLVDNQVVLIFTKKKASWSSKEVLDTLGFDFRPKKGKKLIKKLLPELVKRIKKEHQDWTCQTNHIPDKEHRVWKLMDYIYLFISFKEINKNFKKWHVSYGLAFNKGNK